MASSPHFLSAGGFPPAGSPGFYTVASTGFGGLLKETDA